ncbi:transposase [Chitinivibrio alkaliphilus]|uniref:Transposase n=1 Tax=Chitinivibrio alkaliphilus ACht1 TaxID=1313304 RepID=U7D2K5_9BACT|nr:transposase [Chitinivibrio alkaliphilus]ERP30739.1 transposase [Chitinivibrio alkaliphilus ACht1]
MGNRKKHSSSFKVKVALAALRNDKTMPGLASEFGVHANQIHTWKREFLANATSAFDGDKQAQSEVKELRQQNNELTHLLGEKTLEVSFLKKNCQKLNLL